MVFGEIWARVSRKIVAQVRPRQGNGPLSWSKSGPCWPMLALRWQLEAQLGGFGIDLGSIWHRFGNILAYGSDSRSSRKPYIFRGFSLFWGVWLACSGVLGTVFSDVGSKSTFFHVILGRCCDMLAPRWRPRAPR